MAEKNTLSILETIKKKMQKLDQKTEKSDKISAVSDEFEYISPAKKQSDAQNVEAQKEEIKTAPVVQNSMPKFEDDLGLEDLKEPAAELVTTAPQSLPESKPTTENKSDEFNLDDLDLDDESEITKTPEAAPSVAATVEEKKEDEIDFLAEEESKTEIPAEKNVEEVVAKEPEKSDELDLDLAQEEKKEEVVAPEVAEKNILDFEAKAEESVAAQAEPQLQKVEKEDELNFDDLESDDSEEQLTTPAPAVVTPPVVETVLPPSLSQTKETSLDEFSLDELDKLLAEQQAKKTVDTKQRIASPNEIDLEFEKEIMGLRPEVVSPPPVQQPVAVVPEALVKPTIPTQPAVEPLPQQKKVEPQFQTSHQAAEQLFQSMQEPEKNNVSIMNAPPASAEKEKPVGMINDITVAQSTESIKRLIDAKNVVAGISTFSQSSAFKELAVQLMEPKLEKWLNENLSEVVEGIVREEIKKIIPKD